MAQVIQLRLVRDTASRKLRAQLVGISANNRAKIMRAMGNEFKAIAVGTFGAAGQNRPDAWKPLSKQYAKAIGRSVPTLFMTGAERMKVKKDASLPHLKNKISVASASSRQATITADVFYAAAHQLGGRGLPARPFFPVRKDKPTDFAHRRLMTVLQTMLKRLGAIP